jgi:hypothetical protein
LKISKSLAAVALRIKTKDKQTHNYKDWKHRREDANGIGPTNEEEEGKKKEETDSNCLPKRHKRCLRTEGCLAICKTVKHFV